MYLLDDQIKYSIVAMLDDQILGASISRRIKLDRKDAIEPKIRDYGEGKFYSLFLLYFYFFLVIESLKDWLPAQSMRYIVAPAVDLCNMVTHFLPKNVDEIFRFELGCVRDSSVG